MKKLFLILILFLGLNLFSQELKIKTTDGFALKGWLNFPKVAKKTYPLAFFSHEFGSNHKMWKNISELLRKDGYATFEMDLRGHGKSIMQNNKENKIINATGIEHLTSAVQKSAKKVNFKKIPEDLSAWLEKLSQDKKINMKNPVFFGSSLGGGAIIPLFIEYEPSVVVLFSPASPKSFDKDSVDESISNSEAKILIFSSRDDFALKNAINYTKKALTPTLIVLPGSGHGSALFELAMPYLRVYLDKYLPKR